MSSGPSENPAGRFAKALRWQTLGEIASGDASPGTDKTKDHKPGLKIPQLGGQQGPKWALRCKFRRRGPGLVGRAATRHSKDHSTSSYDDLEIRGVHNHRAVRRAVESRHEL